MTSQWPIRASDRDRESVAEVLCDAYAAGCLDRSELDQRSEGAYSAKTLDELRHLTADLPAWLLKRPVPLPYEYYSGLPPRCPPRKWPVGLMLAFAGFWLVVVAMAWLPPAAVPLTLTWLLAWCARGWLCRTSHRLIRLPQRERACAAKRDESR